MTWTLLDEGGGSVVDFTSFISMDLRSEGQALSYPVEQGGFAHYNKTGKPLALRVSLAAQGANEDFEQILLALDEYRGAAVKLAVVTPSALYENMTLESYSYQRGRENNAGMLTVDLNLVEVREVETRAASSGAASSPKNATSSGKVNTGRTQARAARVAW